MRCGPILSFKVSVSVDTIFEDIICKRAFKVRPHLLPPAKVMFLHLSVILFTRGRGLCIEGGGSASKGVGRSPPHRILRDMVNERAVHILLECILALVKILCCDCITRVYGTE